MSRKFIKTKRIVTLGLTALMLMGSSSSFWDLPEGELNEIALNPLSITVYAADLTNQFKDEIPQWASSDISYLVDKGIMKGYEDSTFRANNTMTRMEFIKATVCSLKTESEIDSLIAQAKANVIEGISDYDAVCNKLNKELKSAGGNYANVTADNFWGTRYLIAADKLGLCYDNGGIVDIANVGGKMGYDFAITREEAATIMINAVNGVRKEGLTATKGVENLIPDINNITIDRAGAVKALVSNGLIAGIDSNYTFAPKKTLTRAEACCILARITDTSRRLTKPTITQEMIDNVHNTMAERDVTYHNPVTGKDETKDINEWNRILKAPTYKGTKDGEYSKDGYFVWDIDSWLLNVDL